MQRELADETERAVGDLVKLAASCRVQLSLPKRPLAIVSRRLTGLGLPVPGTVDLVPVPGLVTLFVGCLVVSFVLFLRLVVPFFAAVLFACFWLRSSCACCLFAFWRLISSSFPQTDTHIMQAASQAPNDGSDTKTCDTTHARSHARITFGLRTSSIPGGPQHEGSFLKAAKKPGLLLSHGSAGGV